MAEANGEIAVNYDDVYDEESKDVESGGIDGKANGEHGIVPEGVVPNVLFVSRFGQGITREDVASLMQRFGPTTDITVKEKIAFIDFQNDEDAARAKFELHRAPGLNSDSLIVDFKKDKNRNGGGGRNNFRDSRFEEGNPRDRGFRALDTGRDRAPRDFNNREREFDRRDDFSGGQRSQNQFSMGRDNRDRSRSRDRGLSNRDNFHAPGNVNNRGYDDNRNSAAPRRDFDRDHRANYQDTSRTPQQREPVGNAQQPYYGNNSAGKRSMAAVSDLPFSDNKYRRDDFRAPNPRDMIQTPQSGYVDYRDQSRGADSKDRVRDDRGFNRGEDRDRDYVNSRNVPSGGGYDNRYGGAPQAANAGHNNGYQGARGGRPGKDGNNQEYFDRAPQAAGNGGRDYRQPVQHINASVPMNAYDDRGNDGGRDSYSNRNRDHDGRRDNGSRGSNFSQPVAAPQGSRGGYAPATSKPGNDYHQGSSSGYYQSSQPQFQDYSDDRNGPKKSKY